MATKKQLQARLDAAQAHAENLQAQLNDLLFAARPFTEKTAWSYTGFGPRDRATEVARNNQAEVLRATIQRITGATLREETLDEATGGKRLPPHFPLQHVRVIEDERMPRDVFMLRSGDDEGEALPEGIRPIGGTGPYVGEIVDPDYNYAAKAETMTSDIEAFLDKQRGEDDAEGT